MPLFKRDSFIVKRGFERLISWETGVVAPAYNPARNAVQRKGVRPMLGYVTKAGQFIRRTLLVTARALKQRKISTRGDDQIPNNCSEGAQEPWTRAVPCLPIFGSASTNRRLSTLKDNGLMPTNRLNGQSEIRL